MSDAGGLLRARGLWATAALALAVRLAIVLTVPVGYPGDMAGWVETTQRLLRDGLAAGYAVLTPGSLYPPAFMYPLWAAGHLYAWCCSPPQLEPGARAVDEIMLLGPILADTALSVLVYALARRWLSPRRALVAGLLYAVCPAALTTGAWQGMIGDPYYGALVVAAVLGALSGRPVIAAICLTLGILLKPQALAFGPLIGLLVLRRASLRQVLVSLAASAATILVVLLPWMVSGALGAVGSAVQGMSGIHAFTQNSADNLWLLLQVGEQSAKVSYLDGAVPDRGIFFAGLTYESVGLLMFSGLYAATLIRLVWAGRARAITLAGAVIGLGFFFLNTRMHVNYVFMAFPFMCIAAASGSRRAQLALVVANVSCLVDWDALGKWPWPQGLPVHQASAALYGLSFVLLCSLAFGPASYRSAAARLATWRLATGRLIAQPALVALAVLRSAVRV